MIGAIRRGGARFSVTVPANASIRAAIAAIPEDAWRTIRYPRAVWDDQLGAWVSDQGSGKVVHAVWSSFSVRCGSRAWWRLAAAILM